MPQNPAGDHESDIVVFTRDVLRPGNGTEFPRQGDHVITSYTAWLYDPHKKGDQYRGKQFDKNECFTVTIGKGRAIKGWEIGVMEMSIGEKSMLTIPSEMAYGEVEFNVIPKNSSLIFEIELNGINRSPRNSNNDAGDILYMRETAG